MGPFDNFDQIYYINLDKRVDRNEQILDEMNKMDFDMSKVTRISGINHEIGSLGCSMSHLNILLDCQKKNYKNCLIFEDDFVFKNTKQETYKILSDFWNTNKQWDIVMFSGYIRKYKPTDFKFLFKVIDAQTTSGYAVNKCFLPTLIKNYQEGIDQYIKLNKKNGQLCIDIYWKKLQENANWFVLYPKLGSQRPGYSDIEKKIVNYKVEINDIH